VRWGLLLLSLLPMLVMFVQLGRSNLLRDRWRRHDLELQFPPGEAHQSLLLVNAGDVPAFAELRSASWSEPRPELLLPGESQMIELSSDPAHTTEVRLRTLDLQAEHVQHVVPLPTGWFKTFIDVDESGAVSSRTRDGGDYSPKRGYVGVETSYALPVRVELPYDAHERPSKKDFEHLAWIGPGVRSHVAPCAFAMDRPASVTLWVPQPTDVERTFEISAGDGATRLTIQTGGTVDRDAIPLWRRVAQVAAF
jgi:hypothetical protein